MYENGIEHSKFFPALAFMILSFWGRRFLRQAGERSKGCEMKAPGDAMNGTSFNQSTAKTVMAHVRGQALGFLLGSNKKRGILAALAAKCYVRALSTVANHKHAS